MRSTRRLARGPARPREAARDHHARARRAVAGAGTFLVSATRLGGRHGYDAAGATSVMGGAVTGFTKALARERADALVKAVDFAPSRKTAALADMLIEETLRDPGAVEIGHADDLRWTVGLVERPAGHDAGARADRRRPCSSSPAPPAASCRRSPPTSRPPPAGRSTCSTSSGAGPGRPRPRALRHRPRRPQARPRRAHQGARRAPDAEARRARARRHRARPRGARRDRGDRARRRHRALAPGRPDRPGAGRRRRSARRSSAAAASTCCCTAPGWRSATSCPTSRSASTTSSSTSRPTAGSTCCTRLGDRLPGAAVVVQPRSPGASATPARPTTRPPTTCCASRSRSLRRRRRPRHRDRLDRLGGHRHGQPRLDPEDDGAGRHRHAAARGRRARWCAAS